MRRKGFAFIVLVLGLALALPVSLAQSTPPAFAAVPPGAPITIAPGFDPVIACNTRQNEYLVVWMRDEPIPGNPSHTSIHVQRVSADGILAGGPLEIVSDTWPGAVGDPAVAYNAVANEYVVVWRDNYKLEASAIRGQRISAGGALIGGRFDVYAVFNENGVDRQVMPEIAYSAGSNVYLVVWFNEAGPAIWGAAVAANGAVLARTVIGDTTIEGFGDAAHHPRLAWNGLSDDFLVVWYALGTGIRARRVSPAGALIGAAPPIIASDAVQNRLGVTFSAGANQYLLVWDAGDRAIGQRVTVGGTRFWDRFDLPNEQYVGGGPDPQTGYSWPLAAYNITSDTYLTSFKSEYRIYTQVAIQHYAAWANPYYNPLPPIGFTARIAYALCDVGEPPAIRPADLVANPTANEWLVAYVDPGCPGAAGALATPATVIVQRVAAPSSEAPTLVTLQEGYNAYAGAQDTWINGWSQTTNYGDDPILRVRTNQWMKPLIRFDMRGQVPTDAVITEALLDLWLVRGVGNLPLQPLQAGAHRVYAEWYDSVATWIMAALGQPWTTPGAQSPWDVEPKSVASQRIEEPAHWVSYDVRDLARLWLHDAGNNFGVILVSADVQSAEYHFASSEYATSSLRPRLRIRYVTRGPLPTPTPTNTPIPIPTTTATPTVPANRYLLPLIKRDEH
jgi:hypothetical protein